MIFNTATQRVHGRFAPTHSYPYYKEPALRFVWECGTLIADYYVSSLKDRVSKGQGLYVTRELSLSADDVKSTLDHFSL